jgi:hypothetical protein
MAKPSPAEIRAAKAYLEKHGYRPPVSPRRLAAAAKEQGKSFSQILQFIARLFQAGQNQPQQAREIVRAAAGA